MMRRALVLLTLLLSLAATVANAITVDGPPGPRGEVERVLPRAVAEVENTLGAIDWSGVTVYIRLTSTSGGSVAPSWAAAFALPATGRIVLRWDRIGSYPWGSPLQVLTHELSHIALARRLGDHEVPRWFDEGLAMAIAREPGPVDAIHVALALLPGRELSAEALDELFLGERGDAQAGYALALSLVGFLEDQGGTGAQRQVVDAVATGVPFETAVERVTGQSFEALLADWTHRTVLLYRWVPLFTSTTTLWVGISLLAIAAWRKKRARMRESEAAWALEEEALDPPDDDEHSAPAVPSETVH